MPWKKKDNHTVKEYTNKVREVLSFVPYAEIVFISALTGQRTNKLFEYIEKVIQFHSMRIQTGVLNEILMEAGSDAAAAVGQGETFEIVLHDAGVYEAAYLCTVCKQQRIDAFFVSALYRNRIRDTFGFIGTPIRMFIRERKEK